MILQQKVLDTVQALGADVSISSDGSLITINGFPPFPLKNIYLWKKFTRAAGTLPVWTGTTTAANSTNYQLNVVSFSKTTGNMKTFTYFAYGDTSATELEINTQWYDQILADVDIPIAPTIVADHLVLTGEAPFYTFTPYSAGAGTTAWVNTTPGVRSTGLGSILAVEQPSNITNTFVDGVIPSTSNSYTYYSIYVLPEGTTDTGNLAMVNMTQYRLYVKYDATNVDTLIGTYGTLTQALKNTIATYSAGTGTLAATAATDLLTLAGGGEFAAQGILAGDVLFQDGESTQYLVNNVTAPTTANAIVGADNAAAAYTIIKLRPATLV